jgi:hypothetical protein
MSATERPRPPDGLSEWARGIWNGLHRRHTFEEHERLVLAAALEWWDRSTAWLLESESASGRDKAQLRKAALDAAQSGLRFWRTLKFPASDGIPVRPGRPAGDAWSPVRRAGAAARRRGGAA